MDVIVDIIEDLNNRRVDVYLNVNNHYEACAPIMNENRPKNSSKNQLWK
ncbi:MAG: hypothetical protein WCE54_23935 [Ignavibacteriaceae bacterium]